MDLKKQVGELLLRRGKPKTKTNGRPDLRVSGNLSKNELNELRELAQELRRASRSAYDSLFS